MNFIDAICKVKGDKVWLAAGPSEIELPPAKGKKLIEGGYDGKTVVLGIRPEDVHDEQMFIEASPNTVIEMCIRDRETVEQASMVFCKGKLCGKDVVVVRSGIGKVNAEMCIRDRCWMCWWGHFASSPWPLWSV